MVPSAHDVTVCAWNNLSAGNAKESWQDAAVSGLCAGVQRYLLFQRRATIIKPFGETALQVFARISALRDSLDGPQVGPGPVL